MHLRLVRIPICAVVEMGRSHVVGRITTPVCCLLVCATAAPKGFTYPQDVADPPRAPTAINIQRPGYITRSDRDGTPVQEARFGGCGCCRLHFGHVNRRSY